MIISSTVFIVLKFTLHHLSINHSTFNQNSCTLINLVLWNIQRMELCFFHFCTFIWSFQSIYWNNMLRLSFIKTIYAESIVGVTKLSGRWSRPISYSDSFRNNNPTPDSDTWRVWGLAKVFFILLIFGLNPSFKF